MKKTIIGLIVLFVIAGSIFAVNNFNSKSKNQANNVTDTQKQPENTAQSHFKPDITDPLMNKTAPQFKLMSLNGKEVSLSDFKGKRIFLNFWATWCPPCRQEIPHIEELYQETKDSDIVILTVDLGEDKDAVNKFIINNNYNFKVLLDSDTSTAAKYNVTGIPTSYFIDKDGIIRAKKVGAMAYEEMKDYINQLNK